MITRFAPRRHRRQLCVLFLLSSFASAMACSTFDPAYQQKRDEQRAEQSRIVREEYIAKHQEQWAEEKKASELAEQEARKQAQIEEDKKQREKSQRWIQLIGEETIKNCNTEIYRLQNLLVENPYDVGGKCYLLDTFSASSIQLLSRTVALLMYQNQVVYVDFGNISAPVQGQWRSFVVKGDVDPYKYTSAAGSAVTAIKVHILKELSKD